MIASQRAVERESRTLKVTRTPDPPVKTRETPAGISRISSVPLTPRSLPVQVWSLTIACLLLKRDPHRYTARTPQPHAPRPRDGLRVGAHRAEEHVLPRECPVPVAPRLSRNAPSRQSHRTTLAAHSATIGLFYRDLGARWLHDDSRWRPSKEGKRSKEGWRICTRCAPLNICPDVGLAESGLGKGWECRENLPPAPRDPPTTHCPSLESSQVYT